ncbi:Sialidase precursor [Maioricimonas rarisocia]|uniref:Sialidase n=1 Tax=Maioricimonas rarisocia TaxID=2528026 RepID=A0A517ZG81_9PLAN|nr:exo-alpha-sialidase [Maioricimonas rarisocia]QDU41485.1 Sialidase precursor [Maioricimonas rarisocia]
MNRLSEQSDSSDTRVAGDAHGSQSRGTRFVALLLTLFFTSTASAAEPVELDAATREKALTILREGMQSDEFWPAIHAAEGLTLAGHGDEAIAFLGPKLAGESDDQQRCGIARELVRAGNRSAAAAMLAILEKEDTYGHTHASESLYKVGELGDGSALRRVFAETDDLRTKLMAAAALAKSGNTEALAFIREMLAHEDHEIFRISTWILARIGDESDIPGIRANIERCPDELTRVYHENALATLGDAAGLKLLAANLQSDDPVVRTYAATFAGDACAISVAPLLIEQLDIDHLDARIRAAQSLLVLAQPRATIPQPEQETRLVLPPGEGNPRNSEGDFIRLNDGRVLYVYTHFTDGAGDHAAAHLAGRFSSDGGATWTDEDTVILPNEAGYNVMSVSLLRMPDDRIALFYLRKNSLEDCRPFLRFSTDEARSWSDPIEIIPDSEVGYYVLNNDRVVRLSSGRLVVPVGEHFGPVRTEWTGDARIVCYLSDDDGQTWRRGTAAEVTKEKPAIQQEPGVVELEDGRVMLFCRTNGGSQYIAHSTDGGETWSELSPSSMQAPVSPASIERIPATGDLLLVWNDHSNIPAELKGKRTPYTIAISRDEGATWQTIRNLQDNPHGWYCYTAVEFVGGNVLLGHCSGDRRENNGLAQSQVTRIPIRSLYSASTR